VGEKKTASFCQNTGLILDEAAAQGGRA